MKKILFYWPNLNKYKQGKFNNTEIISKVKNDNFKVDWDRYHVINSKKWIMNDLFSKIKFEIVDNVKECKNCEIILVLNNLDKLQFNDYENICSINKVYLVHLGDEMLDNFPLSLNLYNKSSFVFRPYFFKSNIKNIMHIPIGYKTSKSFYKEEKKYFWSFCGTIYKSSRHDMLEVFTKNFENYFLHITSFFGDKKSIDADEMYKNISKSIFCLCPNGFFHPETYRIFEVLENNSIPIIQNPYSIYDKIFPNNNLIKINIWSDFLKIMKNLDHQDLLNSNLEWYKNYKEDLRLKIYKIIYG